MDYAVTSMFLHGSWLHIIGNMIYLWAFGPEIEDRMGRGRYLLFYFVGGFVAMFVQVAASPHSRVPDAGRQRSHCRGHGRIYRHISSRPDSFGSYHPDFCERREDPGGIAYRLLVRYPIGRRGRGDESGSRRRGLLCAHRRLCLWGGMARIFERPRRLDWAQDSD